MCEKSWVRRASKNKVKKVVNSVFKSKAEAWSRRIYDWNKVYARVDWSNNEYFVCNPCYSTFYHDHYLKTLPEIETECPQEPPSSQLSPTVDDSASSSSIISKPLRSSSRKRSSYETNREVAEEKICIICNSVKKDKGRIIQPTIISLCGRSEYRLTRYSLCSQS